MSDSQIVAVGRVLSREDILARLRTLLQDVLNLESAESIRPDTRLREDLHVDSLGMLDVVIGVEEAFGLKLSSDINLFEKIVTVDDAMTLIQQSRPSAGTGQAPC